MTERDEMAALADKLEFAANNTEGCLYSQRKMLNAAAQALRSAARTDSDAGYGVKPLEWSHESETAHVPETWRAKSIGREYDIQRTGDGKFDLWADAGTALTVEDTLDEAKAAAQADFEQRIRSVIAALPAPGGKEVTVEEIAREIAIVRTGDEKQGKFFNPCADRLLSTFTITRKSEERS